MKKCKEQIVKNNKKRGRNIWKKLCQSQDAPQQSVQRLQSRGEYMVIINERSDSDEAI